MMVDDGEVIRHVVSLCGREDRAGVRYENYEALWIGNVDACGLESFSRHTIPTGVMMVRGG
jgi:hypothetical protein